MSGSEEKGADADPARKTTCKQTHPIGKYSKKIFYPPDENEEAYR